MHSMVLATMNPYVAMILDHLVPVLAGVLGILGTALIAKLAVVVKAKWNFDLDQAKEDKLHDVLDSAIGHAEEWAHKQLTVTGDKPAGVDKLGQALVFAEDEIKRLGLDAKARDYLQRLIESKLGLTR